MFSDNALATGRTNAVNYLLYLTSRNSESQYDKGLQSGIEYILVMSDAELRAISHNVVHLDEVYMAADDADLSEYLRGKHRAHKAVMEHMIGADMVVVEV